MKRHAIDNMVLRPVRCIQCSGLFRWHNEWVRVCDCGMRMPEPVVIWYCICGRKVWRGRVNFRERERHFNHPNK